jgi:Protein of unknown function (DUF3263)
MPEPLTDLERAVLDFEDLHPIHDAGKLAGIRTTFGWPAARYYQRLHQIILTPAAISTYPMLVHRVNRTLAAATQKRAGRHF